MNKAPRRPRVGDLVEVKEGDAWVFRHVDRDGIIPLTGGVFAGTFQSSGHITGGLPYAEWRWPPMPKFDPLAWDDGYHGPLVRPRAAPLLNQFADILFDEWAPLGAIEGMPRDEYIQYAREIEVILIRDLLARRFEGFDTHPEAHIASYLTMTRFKMGELFDANGQPTGKSMPHLSDDVVERDARVAVRIVDVARRCGDDA